MDIENPLFPLKGDNLIYEAHMYPDADASGQFLWRDEPIDPTVGIRRLKPFFDWLKANNPQGIVGETGCPHDKPFALAAQANAVEYARQNGVRIFYWSAGLWWPEGNETAIEVGGKIRAQWPAINSAAGQLMKDGPG